MDKTNILVFFIFRTGSSFIMQTLRTCYNTEIYGDYGEILTLSEIKKTGFNPNIPDYQLEQYAMANLDGYLRYLTQKSNKQYICSKISLFQMFEHIDKRSLALRSILTRQNTHVVIITRNLLDVFISWKKASKNNRWGWDDTTDLKIPLSSEEFISWHNDTRNKYKSLYDTLSALNKPYTIINYDEMNKSSSNMNKMKYILQKIYQTGINLKINFNKFRETKFLEKQDKNTKHKDQIENYHEFKFDLTKYNLGYNIRV